MTAVPKVTWLFDPEAGTCIQKDLTPNITNMPGPLLANMAILQALSDHVLSILLMSPLANLLVLQNFRDSHFVGAQNFLNE